jgi:sugar O-acyltransferase (sialic acid O-acetyltransferase NeuD family)
MILVGAKGHAKEVRQLIDTGEGAKEIAFFDNRSQNPPTTLYGSPVLLSMEEARRELRKDNRFVLALGGGQVRHDMHDAFEDIGGGAVSVVAGSASIGENADLEDALNIMAFAAIYNSAQIGTGALVHTHASVHHDSSVGAFAELSPGARVLGRSAIGSFTSIGSNATVLPDVSVGDNCVVGAGAVVTQDVPSGQKVVGVPAKPIPDEDRQKSEQSRNATR